MIIYRVKYKGLLTEFAFKPDGNPSQAIILCEGLPVAPKRQETLEMLAQRGLLVFYPRYLGTWESEGEFLDHNPADDLKLLVELIKSGNIKEAFSGKVFSFNIQQITVIGTSFGGPIALQSAAFDGIDKAIALSPIIDFKQFNTQFPEQDLHQLGKFMAEAFTNGYRFQPKNWNKLLEGKILYPAQTLSPEAAKKILIIQCQDDATVNYNPVSSFVNKFGVKYHLLPAGGHFSFSKISKEIWNEIISWINK